MATESNKIALVVARGNLVEIELEGCLDEKRLRGAQVSSSVGSVVNSPFRSRVSGEERDARSFQEELRGCFLRDDVLEK